MGKKRKSHSYRKAIKSRSKYFRLEDYKIRKSDLKGLIQALVITALIAFLFYRNIAGLSTAFLVVPYWLKQYRSEQKNKLKTCMENEFKEYTLMVVNSLQTGYSIEKALSQGMLELEKMYGKTSVLKGHIHVMNQKIAMNIQVERAFLEFAEAINIEEAKSLADILSFAKRAGGDYCRHIKNAAVKIEDRIIVSQEIETMMSEKKLELKIMFAMPLFILMYIALTSKEFIAPLYNNFLGVIVMTICLFLYMAMISLGEKIIDIKI